jgi:hypothetical protein
MLAGSTVGKHNKRPDKAVLPVLSPSSSYISFVMKSSLELLIHHSGVGIELKMVGISDSNVSDFYESLPCRFETINVSVRKLNNGWQKLNGTCRDDF